MKYWNKLQDKTKLIIMTIVGVVFTYIAFSLTNNQSVYALSIFIDAYVIIQYYKLIRNKPKEVMIMYIIVYSVLSLAVIYTIRRGDWFLLLLVFDPFIAFKAYKEYTNIY